MTPSPITAAIEFQVEDTVLWGERDCWCYLIMLWGTYIYTMYFNNAFFLHKICVGWCRFGLTGKIPCMIRTNVARGRVGGGRAINAPNNVFFGGLSVHLEICWYRHVSLYRQSIWKYQQNIGRNSSVRIPARLLTYIFSMLVFSPYAVVRSAII